MIQKNNVLNTGILSVPTEWIVDPRGYGDFVTIVEAVNSEDVKPGDIIKVNPWIYDKPITIEKNLIIIGNGKPENIIIEIDGTHDVIFISKNAEGTKISNLTIKNGDKFNGIKILSNDVIIDYCNVTGNNNGILLENKVENCVIQNCHIFNNGENGIKIEGPSNMPYNTKIKNCTIYNNQNGIRDAGSSTTIEEKCKIFNNSASGMKVFGLDTIIKNSYFHNNLIGIEYGFYLNTEYVKSEINISECEIYENTESGISATGRIRKNDNLWDFREFEIFNCTLFDNINNGITCKAMKKLDIKKTGINDTKDGNGLTMESCNNVNMIDGWINGNGRNGVEFGSYFYVNGVCGNNYIKNCDILNNTDSGVLLGEFSVDNYITYCYIKENGRYSIEIGMERNIINRLTVLIEDIKEYMGLFQDGSCSIFVLTELVYKSLIEFIFPKIPNANHIYLNSLYKGIDTNESAIDIGTNNFWFDESKKFGNYWEGYNQPDRNEDGVVDIPYIIFGNDEYPSRDFYPLTNCVRGKDDCRSPNVTLFCPNGGEYLNGIINISWNASDLKNFDYMRHYKAASDFDNITVDILLSHDDGLTWKTCIVTDYPANNSYYLWNTTQVEDGIDYKISLTAKDGFGNMRTDISSNRFTINNYGPYISNVRITDSTIDSTDFVKDGDDLEITADIIGDGIVRGKTSQISADLHCFEDYDDKLYHPNSYNGSTAIWILPDVKCKQEGEITVEIQATDIQKIARSNTGSIIVDNTPPSANIISPIYGIYMSDRKIVSFNRKNVAIAFGQITFKVDPYDENGLRSVQFYLDGELVLNSGHKEIYKWLWNTPITHSLMRHSVHICVYDHAENCYQTEPFEIYRLY